LTKTIGLVDTHSDYLIRIQMSLTRTTFERIKLCARYFY